MTRLAVVSCYFGPLPGHIPLTLQTMGWNKTVDWLVFTDQPAPKCPWPNIRFLSISFSDFQKRIAEVTGTRVNIPRIHDLHGFKACWGDVLAGYLQDYDFWGHCDLDIVWGDLRHFLSEAVFREFDRVLLRGHLSFYRNTPAITRAYKLPIPGGQNYQSYFADPSSGQFDEWKGMNLIFRYHNLRQFHADFIADIVPPERFFVPPFRTVSQNQPDKQLFYWYHGKLFRAYLIEGGVLDEEFAYLHFQKRILPIPNDLGPFTLSFGIGPRGFFPYAREVLDLATFRSLNRGHWKSPSEIWGVICRGFIKRIKPRSSSLQSADPR